MLQYVQFFFFVNAGASIKGCCCHDKYSRIAMSLQRILFFLLLSEVHDQKYSASGEHIDLSVQTGPDKVVITVGGVYTIT